MLSFDQISPNLECGVDKYMCLPCVGQNTSRRTVNRFWKCLFNGTVYVEFRVCFAMAMYENHMFLLCETSNAFIGAFCYSKIHFHPSGPFKSIKTIFEIFTCLVRFISSMELLSNG